MLPCEYTQVLGFSKSLVDGLTESITAWKVDNQSLEHCKVNYWQWAKPLNTNSMVL